MSSFDVLEQQQRDLFMADDGEEMGGYSSLKLYKPLILFETPGGGVTRLSVG